MSGTLSSMYECTHYISKGGEEGKENRAVLHFLKNSERNGVPHEKDVKATLWCSAQTGPPGPSSQAWVPPAQSSEAWGPNNVEILPSK